MLMAVTRSGTCASTVDKTTRQDRCYTQRASSTKLRTGVAR